MTGPADALNNKGQPKRKRSDSGRPSDGKRALQANSAAAVGNQVAKDDKLRTGFRSEITSIYSSYSSLLSGTGRAQDSSAFKAVLDASQGEPLAMPPATSTRPLTMCLPAPEPQGAAPPGASLRALCRGC